jgi:UDP-GlcNAc:undecaprenyl-phosphate GlcNAc-1-phosphate transferase
MNMVFEYLALSITLYVILAVYLRVARKHQLVDTTNERSSHALPTPRGGGLIIPLAVVLYAVFYWQYNGFFIGLLLVALVSFLDDFKSLSNRWRILIQLVAVTLLVGDTIGFENSYLLVLVAIIVILGTINTVNFMDGINGISVAFGTVSILAFIYLNTIIDFVDQQLLLFSLIGILVFGFFNFRKQAKCFSGDVGSISLGYILVYFTLLYFLKTGDKSVIVLWTVYGVDSVLTIIHRLLKNENIFKAHRSHLYQYYTNELGRSHLTVASWYGIIQGIINVLFILNMHLQILSPLIFTAIILVGAGIVYIFIKMNVERQVQSIQNTVNEKNI